MSEASQGLPRLERAAHLRKDLDFLEAELARPKSVLVPVWRDSCLVTGDQLALLSFASARGLLELGGELVWLGKLGDNSCFAMDLGALAEPMRHPALAGSGELKDLRFVGATLPAEHAALAAYARALLHWHTRQRHCGVCGQPTAARDGGHLRVCKNEACGTQHFPRTDPAVIMLVRNGDACLLGRQRNWPRGMYSTLAGFVEPGETIEEAVVREVAEEAGIMVHDVRYFRSQPWPFPASLMLGFTARATSREIRLGDDELEDARWFTRDEIRDCHTQGLFVPRVFSLAGQLIAAFVADEIAPP
jgi:NAD+ diphosphatase